MDWQSLLQILAIVFAFIATGASQFIEVKKKESYSRSWLKNLTNWGKAIAITFILSIILAIGSAILTNFEGEANKQTLSEIVTRLQYERKFAVANDSARLKASIDILGRSYVSIWLHPPMNKISKQDSINLRNRLLGFSELVLSELKSLSGNLVLLKNRNLSAFLISVGNVVNRAQLTLYGYDFTSLGKVNDVLQLVGTELRNMSDNFVRESYFRGLKIDTNLYPIIKTANDSAWVE